MRNARILAVVGIVSLSLACGQPVQPGPLDGPSLGGSSTSGGGSSNGGSTSSGSSSSSDNECCCAVVASVRSLTFESLVGVTSQPQPFQVENACGQTSGLPTAALSGANAADFALSANSCTGALEGNSACSLSVVFMPTFNGLETANLTITANPGTSAAGIPITLMGAGIAPAQLIISPNIAGVASSPIGTPSTPITFTLTNTGGKSSGPINVYLAGANASDFQIIESATTCSAPLAGSKTCTIAVGFSPTFDGPESALLTVSSNPGATTALVVPLSGYGTEASLAINPSSMSFGSLPLGTVAVATFTLTNTGTEATGIPAISFTGGQASFFSETDTCSAALSPGGTCTLFVTFAPTATGSVEAQMNVFANPGGFVVVPLSATVVAPASLALTPTAEDFGAVATGLATIPVAFTANNSGDEPTGKLTTSVTGANAADFILTDGCTGRALPAGGSCNVDVTFQPATDGGATATLQVTDGTLTSQAVLSGSGS